MVICTSFDFAHIHFIYLAHLDFGSRRLLLLLDPSFYLDHTDSIASAIDQKACAAVTYWKETISLHMDLVGNDSIRAGCSKRNSHSGYSDNCCNRKFRFYKSYLAIADESCGFPKKFYRCSCCRGSFLAGAGTCFGLKLITSDEYRVKLR